MRAVALIAGNFLREQRWPLLLLVAWVAFSGIVAGIPSQKPKVDDVLFFVKQQAVYGVAFCAFLAASAIYNERKSRRILAVLSKGVTQLEYVAGLLAGVTIAGLVYCVAMGAAGGVIFEAVGLPEVELWRALALVLAASILTAAISMFFSTWLNPFLATSATAISLATPGLLGRLAGPAWYHVLPVYRLMQLVIDFSGAGFSPTVIRPLIFWALLDSFLLWLAASWVFSYRDIAVAVE